jgi:hypothetical protein
MYGGGFTVNGSVTGDISDCTFSGNGVAGDGSGYLMGRIHGGGFYVNTLNGNIGDCTFVGNWTQAYSNGYTAPWSAGAGFYVQTLNGRVARCLFSENLAINDDNGGKSGQVSAPAPFRTEWRVVRLSRITRRLMAPVSASRRADGGVSDSTFLNNREAGSAAIQVDGVFAAI